MSATTTQPYNTTNTAGVPPAPPELTQKQVGDVDFTKILQQALTVPGIVNQAYRAFHNFSLGNQILAAMQLAERGLGLSPLASFMAWKGKGRCVKKGEKAISLFMPITIKKAHKDEATGDEVQSTFSKFVLKPHWFSLEQTDGEEFAAEMVAPAWNAERAMQTLEIEEVRFDELRGNVMGYASGKQIAISPVNPLKHKTRFHEIAHVVLGHTADAALMADGSNLPRDIKEAEAEGVAYILCALLDLPGQAESRGYIQGWLADQPLPERSARRIFSAADKIMKAGQQI